MVATDGRRLAVARGACRRRRGRSRVHHSDARRCNLVERLVRDPDAPVRVAIDENQALFAIGKGDAAVGSLDAISSRARSRRSRT